MSAVRQATLWLSLRAGHFSKGAGSGAPRYFGQCSEIDPRYALPLKWPSPELPLTQWNVLDRARIPVNDHVVWEPVDFLFSVFVDVGKTDVHRAHILVLN